MRQFKVPEKSLANLDVEASATLLGAAADVALVLDDSGTIRDRAFSSEELARALLGAGEWIGQAWVDTVTVESRTKVEEMLAEAVAGMAVRRRQVNHPAAGRDVPIVYSTTRLAPGRLAAVGRDQLPVAELQQRLVEAQNVMERDYARVQQVEMRYRLLFDASPEVLAIVDSSDMRVADANPAARQQFAPGGGKLAGRLFLDLFDEAGAQSVRLLLDGVRASGRADSVKARVAGGGTEILVSAKPMRQDNATLFLVRITGEPSGDATMPKLKAKMLKVVEQAPDAVVVTSPEGNVLTANAAFLDLVHLATEEQAHGQALERWLGRPGIDLGILTGNLKRHGSVRLFSTTLRAEYGVAMDVEVSAVAVMNGGRPCYGFAIRNVTRRLGSSWGDETLPRSVSQLKEVIGRVSLKDLVRETTDLIERRCIEAALEMTNDNRASAAEMLGLSRQSLYIKLKRYGIAELAADDS